MGGGRTKKGTHKGETKRNVERLTFRPDIFLTVQKSNANSRVVSTNKKVKDDVNMGPSR